MNPLQHRGEPSGHRTPPWPRDFRIWPWCRVGPTSGNLAIVSSRLIRVLGKVSASSVVSAVKAPCRLRTYRSRRPCGCRRDHVHQRLTPPGSFRRCFAATEIRCPPLRSVTGSPRDPLPARARTRVSAARPCIRLREYHWPSIGHATRPAQQGQVRRPAVLRGQGHGRTRRSSLIRLCWFEKGLRHVAEISPCTDANHSRPDSAVLYLMPWMGTSNFAVAPSSPPAPGHRLPACSCGKICSFRFDVEPPGHEICGSARVGSDHLPWRMVQSPLDSPPCRAQSPAALMPQRP